MGPPPRPNPAVKTEKAEKEEKERITDIGDISDAIFGSGIDLREEENYLSNTFRNTHSQQSFNQSFDSGSTVLSPSGSFDQLSQGAYGSQPAFGGSGPISRPAASQESIEAELNRKHQAAARAYAQQREHHLRDPFLLGNTIRHRIHTVAIQQGVTLDIKGLYEPEKKQPAPPNQPHGVTGVTAVGPNGTGMVSIRGQSIPEAPHAFIEEAARYADILSLVSLAANDRVRALLDESYTIARGRRYGSHGVVPPDLQDLADGDGRRAVSVKTESITGTSWDKSKDSSGEDAAMKGKHKIANGLKASTILMRVADTGLQSTVAFTNRLTEHLQNLAVSDRDAELARIRKRQERAKKMAAAEKAALEGGPDASTPVPTSGGANSPATPATPSADFASSVAPGDAKSLTKKEREKASKVGQTEEVLHKNANSTAAMQLGFGKKAKRYSWMNSAAPSNPFAKPSVPKPVINTNVNGTKGGADGTATSQTAEKGMEAKEHKWGSWREDGIEGKGIQMRDLALVLERDGRGRKALHQCFMTIGAGDQA